MEEKIIKIIDNLLKENITYDKVVETFYNIGSILNENNTSYHTIFKIEDLLINKYGKLISFSRKNLNTMMLFSKTYKDLDKIKKVDWNTHLFILKRKNKEQLIDFIIQNKLNKREIEYYVKNNKIKKIEMNYEDPATEEIKKIGLNKNNNI